MSYHNHWKSAHRLKHTVLLSYLCSLLSFDLNNIKETIYNVDLLNKKY